MADIRKWRCRAARGHAMLRRRKLADAPPIIESHPMIPLFPASALATAALLALAPLAAQADSLTLPVPLAGGTVHTDRVDMSVFWRASGEAAEVVAYYVSRPDGALPQKLQMRLAPGDRVVFGLPGLPDATYSFERDADGVTVTASPLRSDLALN